MTGEKNSLDRAFGKLTPFEEQRVEEMRADFRPGPIEPLRDWLGPEIGPLPLKPVEPGGYRYERAAFPPLPRVAWKEAPPPAGYEPERFVFSEGDWVEKHSGEARYVGRVTSAYRTSNGGCRYVVEVWPQGFQMICTAGMLRPLQPSANVSFGLFRGNIIIIHPEMPPHMWNGKEMVKIEMGVDHGKP